MTEAEEKVKRLTEVLMMVEWTTYHNCTDNYYYQECQWCSGQKAEGGHKPDCPRQAALGLGEKAQ